MKLIRGIAGLRLIGRENAGGLAVTIGNFDGVHRGHQSLLAHTSELASELNALSVVMIIEPHALEVLKGDAAPPRVLPFAAKIRQLEATGINAVAVMPFSQIREFTAETFASETLQRARVRAVVAGEDFHFGAGRSGDITALQKLGANMGINVVCVPNTLHLDRRISSTWLREALQGGDFQQAQQLLGRPYQLGARVVKGQQRGRTLGFPTANLHIPPRRALCLSGVYAVHAVLPNSQSYAAVANIGSRPTLGAGPSFEVHLLDFDGDLYGQHLSVNFVQKLRPEHQFESVEALRAQIQKDCIQASEVLSA